MQNNPGHQIGNQSLTGTTQDHLVEWRAGDVVIGQSLNREIADTTYLVHREVAKPLSELRALAGEQGFDLRLCSSFRSFDRQLAIWNNKASGLRPVLDDSGAALDTSQLSEWQLVEAILRWSALPGASRHHWGTDFDIYDAAAIDENYRIQLTPEEVEGEGVFAPLHNWLDGVIDSTGFYRPYAQDSGGIAPERWHISYRPVADQFAAGLTWELLAELLSNTDILLKNNLLDNLDKIYPRYIELK